MSGTALSFLLSKGENLQRAGCGSLILLILGFGLVLMLIESPAFWISLGVVIVVGVSAYLIWKQNKTSKNIEQMHALRPQLLKFTKGFEPLEDLYLSLRLRSCETSRLSTASKWQGSSQSKMGSLRNLNSIFSHVSQKTTSSVAAAAASPEPTFTRRS